MEQMIKRRVLVAYELWGSAKMYLFRTADQAKKLAKMNEDV